MMKKLLLLSTLVCANHLYGMEPLYPESDVSAGSWHNLPTDVKSLIITAVAQSGNNLDEAVKNIVRFSQVNKELNKMVNLNDLKGFTKIIHMLADKFKITDSKTITGSFKTATADQYADLLTKLQFAIAYADLDEVKELIKEGADINGPGVLHLALFSLKFSDFSATYNLMKFLLDNGANPYAKDKFDQILLEDLIDAYKKRFYSNLTQAAYEQMKALIEEAMRRYNQ